MQDISERSISATRPGRSPTVPGAARARLLAGLRTGLLAALVAVLGGLAVQPGLAAPPERPNFVLILSDDQGWGETSYNGHPVLQTPNLDALAANGITLTRFYASAPNCSPTRAALLTGRSNDRTGVVDHGYRLRHEEVTIAEILSGLGYATGHFGKWHLGGLQGPGVPILAEDAYGPASAGFATWVSTTNYFDDFPMVSRNGIFANLAGDSSEAIAGEAIGFMQAAAAEGRPFFAAVWLGAPHQPWRSVHRGGTAAGPPDRAPGLADHYGEITGIDNSVGMIRSFLRRAGLAGTTLVWFQSDNGSLKRTGPEGTGGLRGYKNSLYEGGIRVPSAVEWPGMIPAGQACAEPVASVDFLPTIAAILDIPEAALPQPMDGRSVLPLLQGEPFDRGGPLHFRHLGRLAAIDGSLKLLVPDLGKPKLELYDLATDPHEAEDLAQDRADLAARMYAEAMAWSASVDASLEGLDYGAGPLQPPAPPVDLADSPLYHVLVQRLGRPDG